DVRDSLWRRARTELVLPSKHKNSREHHDDARQQDRPPIWSAKRPDGVASPECNFVGFCGNFIPRISNQSICVWARKSRFHCQFRTRAKHCRRFESRDVTRRQSFILTCKTDGADRRSVKSRTARRSNSQPDSKPSSLARSRPHSVMMLTIFLVA